MQQTQAGRVVYKKVFFVLRISIHHSHFLVFIIPSRIFFLLSEKKPAYDVLNKIKSSFHELGKGE